MTWILVLLTAHMFGDPSRTVVGHFSDQKTCEAQAEKSNKDTNAAYWFVCAEDGK